MSEKLQRRTRGAPRKATEAKTLSQALLDKLFGLMRHRLSDSQLSEAALKLKAPPELVPRYVKEVRRQLTLAADYNRDEEIGRLNLRWEDFLQDADAKQDLQAKATALKEMAKLKALYETPKPSVWTDTASNDEAEAVKRHLMQFELSPNPETPLYEIIRLAAHEMLNRQVENDRLQAEIVALKRKSDAER